MPNTNGYMQTIAINPFCFDIWCRFFVCGYIEYVCMYVCAIRLTFVCVWCDLNLFGTRILE